MVQLFCSSFVARVAVFLPRCLMLVEALSSPHVSGAHIPVLPLGNLQFAGEHLRVLSPAQTGTAFGYNPALNVLVYYAHSKQKSPGSLCTVSHQAGSHTVSVPSVNAGIGSQQTLYARTPCAFDFNLQGIFPLSRPGQSYKRRQVSPSVLGSEGPNPSAGALPRVSSSLGCANPEPSSYVGLSQ